MCDPVLIAAILEELGYFDEEKEKVKKDDVRDEWVNKNRSQNGRDEKQK